MTVGMGYGEVRRGLAEGAAGVVDVDFGLGLADDLGGGGDLGQVGDTEQAIAFAAAHAPVGGAGIKPPTVAATRTSGNDMHPITLSVPRVYQFCVSL